MTAVVERTSAPHTHRVTRPSALVVLSDPAARADVTARLRALGIGDVAEADSAAAARALAADGPRGLAVLDLALPDGSGLRLLAELRGTGVSRAVMLSPNDDPHAVRAALASGVKGYLASGSRARPLATVWNPPSQRRGRTGPDGLSAREVEVLRLVADGRSNREIGDELGLSALTVKSHLARIGRKLGSGDRAEMVALAMRAGVLA